MACTRSTSKYLIITICVLVVACSKQKPEHPSGDIIFQLSTRLSQADIWTDHFELDFGTAGSRRYLNSGWSHDETTGDYTWVWAQGLRAELKVPLIPDPDANAYQLKFSAWPVKFAGSDQSITVSVNGSEVQSLNMKVGPDNYRLGLPGDLLEEGMNSLSFDFAHAISPASQKTSIRDDRELAVAFRALTLSPVLEGNNPSSDSRLPSSVGSEISQPGGTEIRYQLHIPAGARFRAGLGFSDPDNAGKAHVRLRLQSGEVRTLYSGGASNGDPELIDYNLAPLAGKRVQLELAADTNLHRIIWSNPSLIVKQDYMPAASLSQPAIPAVGTTNNPRKPFIAPGLRYEKVLEGDVFVAMDLHNNALFVGEKQTGIIRVYRDGMPNPSPVVDFDVDGFNERGLLGLALHPDYPQKPYLYAFYSASLGPAGEDSFQKGVSDKGNRLVRLTLENEIAIDEQVLHTYETHALGYHNGGTLRFDREGALWLGIGDTLRLERTQDLALPQGKMHRYADNGSAWPDNHYARDNDNSTLDSIYALGLRNPWNFTFHPGLDSIYSVDIGHNIGDELNILENGANYGWPEVEGVADGWKELMFAEKTPMYRNPIWESGLRSTCPSAIAVARGNLHLERHIVWGDCNRPWRIQAAGLSGLQDQFLASEPVDLVRMHGRPVNMMWDTNGNLLVVTMEAEGYKAGGSIRKLSVADPVAFRGYMERHIPSRMTRIEGESWSDYGRRLYEEKNCVNCHSTDGSRMSGPSFKGIFETQRALEGGDSVLVDHKYIVESILNPGARISQGYSSMMPSYKGQLDNDQLLGLSHFIKSLR